MHSTFSLWGEHAPIRNIGLHWPRVLRSLTVVVLSVGIASLAMAQPSSSRLSLGAALDAAQARSATLAAQDAATRACLNFCV